jgi:hypothetical protein
MSLALYLPAYSVCTLFPFLNEKTPEDVYAIWNQNIPFESLAGSLDLELFLQQLMQWQLL